MAERSNQSPFPGMDPYMERRWRDVHASLIPYIRDAIQPKLPDDLVAKIEEDVRVDAEGDEVARRNPDVYVAEDPVPWAVPAVPAASSHTVQPILLEVAEDPLVERHVEVVEQEGGRVVTAIEVLSPWNKLEGSGRARYLRKREEYLASGANLVEIDLLRAGKWWTLISPHRAGPEHRTPYRVTVKRPSRAQLELYAITLPQRLPEFGVPLRRGEADVLLDLQPLIDQIYRNGRFDRTDYTKPCDPPLEGEDAKWAQELLRNAGRA